MRNAVTTSRQRARASAKARRASRRPTPLNRTLFHIKQLTIELPRRSRPAHPAAAASSRVPACSCDIRRSWRARNSELASLRRSGLCAQSAHQRSGRERSLLRRLRRRRSPHRCPIASHALPLDVGHGNHLETMMRRPEAVGAAACSRVKIDCPGSAHPPLKEVGRIPIRRTTNG